MKKLGMVFVLCLFAATSIRGQNEWHWQNPLPQGDILGDVYSFSQSTAIAVGSSGTIIKTTDGGLTWSFKNSGTKVFLRSISFINQHIGWVAGDESIVLKTGDGGDSWEMQYGNVLFDILAIHFVDQNNGWGVGSNGKIHKTTDGGTTWTMSSFSSNDMHSVFFSDIDHGWICGSFGSILKTTNRGDTWTPVAASAIGIFRDLSFSDSLNGVAIGTAGIVRTSNGGTSWFYVDQGYRNGVSICLLANGKGWAAGLGRSHAYTLDGGYNWSYEPGNGAYEHLNAVSAADECSVWMVGYAGNIFKATSGSVNLVPVSCGTNDELRDIFFINPRCGWAVGGRANPFDVPTIYRTTNGGIHWIPIDLPINNTLFGVHFNSNDIGWAVGADGLVIKTIDGGIGWSVQQVSYPNTLMDVFFVDDTTGWIVGTGETILKTTDAGIHWIDKSSGLTTALSAVYFVDENIGWATGPHGKILKTTDGGDHWEAQPSGLSQWYADVFFHDANNGWIAAGPGRLLRTTNGGTTWTVLLLTPSTNYSFLSVHFAGPTHGYACGTYGLLMKTTDGGNTWIQEGPYTSYGLNAVFVADVQTVWTVGDGGGILKYGDAPSIGNLTHDGLNLPISDFNTTEDIIVAYYPEAYVSSNELHEVEVRLDTIVHSADSDLTICLSHLGITDTLVDGAGGDGDDFIGTRIMDACLTSISDGFPPFTGDFKPHFPLAPFAGTDPNGEWKLTIRDGAAGNAGVLQAWGLKLYFERLTDVRHLGKTVPLKCVLFQNYPNPFNPTTTIAYQLPTKSRVTLKMYDVLGREVATLVDGVEDPGRKSVQWNAQDLSSGMYFYRLVAGGVVEARKLLLVR